MYQASTSFIKTSVKKRGHLNRDKRKDSAFIQYRSSRSKPVTLNFCGFTARRAMYFTWTNQLFSSCLSLGTKTWSGSDGYYGKFQPKWLRFGRDLIIGSTRFPLVIIRYVPSEKPQNVSLRCRECSCLGLELNPISGSVYRQKLVRGGSENFPQYIAIKLPAQVSHLQPSNDTNTISALIVYVTRLV